MFARTPLILLAALAALVVAGCGGDDDGSGGGSDSLTAEEYDTQTEAALETFTSLDELSAPLANPESVEQYVAGIRDIVTEIEGAIGELEAIEAPAEVAPVHDDLIAAVEGYGAAFPPVADAAEAGDEAALQASAAELQAAAIDFQEMARELDQQFQDAGIELAPLAG